MARLSDPEDQESDDEYNAQETLNLLNLIKRDLEEDDDIQSNTQTTPITNDDNEDGNTRDCDQRNDSEQQKYDGLETLREDNHGGGEDDFDGEVSTEGMMEMVLDVNQNIDQSQSEDAPELTSKPAVLEPSATGTSIDSYMKEGERDTYVNGLKNSFEESTIGKMEHNEIDDGDDYSSVSEIECSEASNEHQTNTDGLHSAYNGGSADTFAENLTEKSNMEENENRSDAIHSLSEDLLQNQGSSTKPETYAIQDTSLCDRLHEIQEQMDEEKKKYNKLLEQLNDERMEKEKLKNSLQTLLGHYYDKRNTEDQLKYLVSDIEEEINTENTRPSHNDADDSLAHHYYKKEILQLKERLRIAEVSNERMEEDHRSSVLKERTRHQLERTSMEEEIETQRHKIYESDAKHQQLLRDIEQMKLDLNVRNEQYKATQVSLQKTQLISDQRKGDLDEATGRLVVVTADLAEAQKRVEETDEEIVRLQTQLRCKEDEVALQREDVEKLRAKISEMEKVKVKYKELKIQVKKTEEHAIVRGEKVKLLKKHIKQVQEEKEEVERVAETVPELQQKIAHLQETIGAMKQKVLEKQMEEEEKRKKELKEKEEEKERREKEKKDWEKRVLGIGTCLQEHEEISNVSSSPTTSITTTSLFKPRPPSSQHSSSQSLQRKVILLPSSYPLNYLEDRRSPLRQTKNNNHQETFKPITTKTKTYKRNKSAKRVPSKLTRADQGFIPRVLEWGDGGLIDQALAVGNQVIFNIRRECISHGDTSQQSRGVVRFIGFVKDNEEDVYIGIRLDEGGVGWTDGAVNGQRYFKCEKDRGVFVRLGDVVEKVDSASERLPKLQMKNDIEVLSF